jgi:small-conductance mechanosensitive channel
MSRAARLNRKTVVVIALLVAYADVPLSLFAQEQPKKPQTEAKSQQPDAKPIAVPDIADRSAELAFMVRAMAVYTEPDESVEAIADGLKPFATGVNDLSRYSTESLKTSSNMRRVADLLNAWQAVSSRAAEWASQLQKRASEVEAARSKLANAEKEWAITLESEDLRELPEDVRKLVGSSLESIRSTQKAVDERRNKVVLLQADLAARRVIINSALEEVRAAGSQQRMGLITLDSPPIWQAFSTTNTQQFPGGDSEPSVYYADWIRSYGDVFLRRAGLFFAVTMILWFAIRRLRTRGADWKSSSDENVRALSAAIDRPVSLAIFIAVILTALIARDAPLWMIKLAILTLLIPSVRLLGELVGTDLKRGFYILIALMVLLQVLSLPTETSLWNRLGWLVIQVISFCYLGWLSRMLHRRATQGLFSASMRIVAILSAIAAGIAVAANVAGMVQFSQLVMRTALYSVYAAVVLRGIVVILSGSLVSFLRSRQLDFVAPSKRNRDQLERRMTFSVKFLGAVAFAAIVLYLTTLLDPFTSSIDSFLGTELRFGALRFTLHNVFAFILVTLGAILISNLFRFVVEVSVYPRLRLQKGQAQAFSKILHYIVLLVGIAIAAAAAGVGLSNLAILAGGLSVGIGFGLQNIVNNFVSGLILLFERPIQVGDSVTVGSTSGMVADIGIRASLIRAWDGAEVIVPNGNLISGELTNWTHSDANRRVDVKVGTAYGSDPQQVIQILTRIAREHPQVLTEPEPPIALFIGFGDSSLDFVLRFFCHTDFWVNVSSEIYTQVYEALKHEGIEIPFPQRDLHIRAIPASFVESDQLKSWSTAIRTNAAGEG